MSTPIPSITPISMSTPTPPVTPITTTWDVIYATRYATLNTTIANQWQSISIDNYQQTIPIGGKKVSCTLNATFAPWQLTTGGDGRNVRFDCPIQSGSVSFVLPDGTFNSYPFPDTSLPSKELPVIEIELELEWIPDASQKAFEVSDQPTIDKLVPSLNSLRYPTPDLIQLFKTNSVTLSSNAQVVPKTPGLEWTIQDNETTYYILYTNQIDSRTKTVETEFLFVYQLTEAWKANLTILEADITKGGSPPITVRNIQDLPTLDTDGWTPALSLLMSNWFNSNLSQFTQIFAQANITLTLDQTKQFNWLVPTAIDYAVTDTVSVPDGIFGMLIMTDGNPVPVTTQVPANAIPDDCDAAFIINGPVFVENMLLPGAMATLGITDSSYFTIDDQNLQVLLAKDYQWGPFITDNNPVFGTYMSSDEASHYDRGELYGLDLDFVRVGINSWNWSIKPIVMGQQWLITLDNNRQFILTYSGSGFELSNVCHAATITIPAKQFSLTLNNDQVQLQLINFNYVYPDDNDLNVSVNYTENWNLTLKEVNGQNIFWFTAVSDQQLTDVITKSQNAITRELIESIVGPLITLMTGVAAVATALQQTVTVAIDAGETAATVGAEVTGEVEQVIEANATQVVASESSAAIQSQQGFAQNLISVVNTPKWLALGTLATICGASAGIDTGIVSIIQGVAQNNPQANLPDFGTFVENTIKPYTWPGVQGFTLEHAYLANALVIGLKLQKSS